MEVTLRRILFEGNVEGWTVYSKTKDCFNIDIVIIIFEENRNLLYLLSDNTDRLDDADYLTNVCNLVHDLPKDFLLVKKEMEGSPTDVLIDTLVEECKNNRPDTCIPTAIED
ncbi:hypothetical protein [Clostridium sp. Marseille-P2415]|uniref:hypothetical protein n=1 Tax=Clostridium sp. Marseille-P2415 TaxID=1805471 RepID=UPI000988599C|nr:hypothetical protein [Clostridium sp. Marseille-P2415]